MHRDVVSQQSNNRHVTQENENKPPAAKSGHPENAKHLVPHEGANLKNKFIKISKRKRRKQIDSEKAKKQKKEVENEEDDEDAVYNQ